MTGCNITPLADAGLDSALVERMTTRAVDLIQHDQLHNETAVALAVASYIEDDTVDAFIIVANHVARTTAGDLLAVVAIRKWAERHRPHLLTI